MPRGRPGRGDSGMKSVTTPRVPGFAGQCSQPGGWRLQNGDDGSGISATDLHESERYGVVGMRERVAMLGGTFSIRRGAGGGSIVEAWVPSRIAVEASAA